MGREEASQHCGYWKFDNLEFARCKGDFPDEETFMTEKIHRFSAGPDHAAGRGSLHCF